MLNLQPFSSEELILILLLGVLLDLVFGEPPEKIHPVVWFGRLIGFFDSKWKRGKLDLFAGILSVLAVIFFAFMLSLPVSLLNYPLNMIWAVYLLFTSVSIKSMVLHAKKTYEGGHLDANAVQMIVSRDTSSLDESQLISAVIESIAENFVDGVFAPLFYFSIFGIYGVVLYKAINVCDAMIGYKKRNYLYFGKFAAKLDDVVNFVPSRLSVLLFSIFSLNSIKYALRYKTKLNGHAIAAMAGLLEVKIEKPKRYVINGRLPKIGDIERSIKVYWMLCLMAILFSILLILVMNVLL